MLKLLNIATCLFVGALVSCAVILEVFHKSYILQMLARLSDDETEVLIELSHSIKLEYSMPWVRCAFDNVYS